MSDREVIAAPFLNRVWLFDLSNSRVNCADNVGTISFSLIAVGSFQRIGCNSLA